MNISAIVTMYQMIVLSYSGIFLLLVKMLVKNAVKPHEI